MNKNIPFHVKERIVISWLFSNKAINTIIPSSKSILSIVRRDFGITSNRYHDAVSHLHKHIKKDNLKCVYGICYYRGVNGNHLSASKTKNKKGKKKAKHGNGNGNFYLCREWRELRIKALLKYGRKCCMCGRSPKDGVILHVDHIKPRSKYPSLELDIDNLQILCEDCNLGKSNHYQEDWR